MFGLSLTKILITLAVGLVVWGLYRALVVRRAIPQLGLRARLKAAWREAFRSQVADRPIALARCSQCGDHVAVACARADCPLSG